MSSKGMAALLSVAMLLGTTVCAEESVGFDVSADFFGKYVWRGQNLTNSSVFQPGIGVNYGDLSGSIWGSLDMTDTNGNSGEFTEFDFTLDYSTAVPGMEGLGFSIGAIQYNFPGSIADDTLEVYWGFSVDVPLSPSITVYHDVDEANGTYVAFGVSHAIEKIFELSSDMPVGMEVEASIGWGDSGYNEYYWGIDENKMNDLSVSVAFPVEVLGWTVCPSINYVTLLNDSIRDTNQYSSKSDYVFAGVGLSKSF